LVRSLKRQKTDEEPDLPATQLKQWVVNLSKYKLTNSETKVLAVAKGLSFAVSSDTTPKKEYIVATKQASWHLPPDQAESLRADMAGLIYCAKPPQSNIGKDERRVIDDLKKRQDIMILAADKGKATVVLDKDDYKTKVKQMLSDTKTYEVLKKDPTTNYKRKLVSI